jgi:SAM-dependent methyltransferase
MATMRRRGVTWWLVDAMSQDAPQAADGSVVARASLDAQQEQWERALTERADRFGVEASDPARAAAEQFQRTAVRDLLELGAGQGRDTLFFAEQGFSIHALDYADSGLSAIRAKADAAGFGERIEATKHDVRQRLPFADSSFDACFSHMLYCMALTAHELSVLTAEVRRVLRPGGLHVYTARTTSDPDYRKGEHRGEQLYELGGFVVHFFDRDLVERAAAGFDIVAIDEFEEGTLPRRLYRVTLRRA